MTTLRPAPAKAYQIYIVGEDAPKANMAITTAKAAPALTLKIPGSANELRVIPWIIAPAVDIAAPTMIASSDRGNLTVRIIRCSLESSKDLTYSYGFRHGDSRLKQRLRV